MKISNGTRHKAQLMVLLVALDQMRTVYPDSVEEYCQSLLGVARAIGLPGDLPIEDTGKLK